jgi:hypothetical protein
MAKGAARSPMMKSFGLEPFAVSIDRGVFNIGNGGGWRMLADSGVAESHADDDGDHRTQLFVPCQWSRGR